MRSLDQNEIAEIIEQMGESSIGLPPVDMSPEDGIRTLQELEAEVFAGAIEARRGVTRWAIAIFTIMHYSLWTYAVDEREHPLWATQEAYLGDLIDRGKIARATAFGHLSSIRVALSMGFDIDDIAESGLAPFNIVKRFIEYNRATGEITGLKDKELESEIGGDIKAFIRQQVESVMPMGLDNPHDLDLIPRDLNGFFTDALQKHRQSVSFIVNDTVSGGIKVWYALNGDMPKEISDSVPQIVYDKLVERLHASTSAIIEQN